MIIPVGTRESKSHNQLLAILDSGVTAAYRRGFTQSVIINVTALLILSFLVIRPESHSRPIALAMKFESLHDSDQDLVLSPVAELTMPAEVSEDEETDAVIVAAVAMLDSPAEVAVFDEQEDTFALDVENTADLVDLPTTDLLTEVRSPRTVPSSHAVLRGPPRLAQAASWGRGSAGGGGIDGELGRRLQAAGAKTGDVQVSIRWDNVNDIDVHVKVEALTNGRWSLINFMNRFGQCGGLLDVDANAHSAMLVPQPVENVFWGKGKAPYGRYTVAIHHYRNWAGPVQTPVEVAVLVDGQVQRFQVNTVYGAPPAVVTSFVRQMPRPINEASSHEAAKEGDVRSNPYPSLSRFEP